MSAPETQWRRLLDLALPALDHVFGQVDDTKPTPWTLGDGPNCLTKARGFPTGDCRHTAHAVVATTDPNSR